jgi:hypothetical protein
MGELVQLVGQIIPSNMKDKLHDKVFEYRIRAAALLMPKGSSIHIEG